MAYVIISAHGGEEVDRRELTGPAVVGRAPDCDVAVHDILLSRRHCRLEPAGDEHPGRWVVVDLGSKNGTFRRSQRVTRHLLKDGDDVRVGRSILTFKAGAFVPASPEAKKRAAAAAGRARPVDPTEALSGTVAGFTLVEPGEVEHQPGAPVPQPRPKAPAAYQSDQVFGLVTEMVASSWDSIMATNSRPLAKERPLPSPNATVAGPRVARPAKQRVSFSLQADVVGGATGVAELSPPQPLVPTLTTAAPVPSLEVVPVEPAKPASIAPPRPRRRQALQTAFVVLATILLTLLMVGTWVAVCLTLPRGA